MSRPLDSPIVRKRILYALLTGCSRKGAAASGGMSEVLFGRWSAGKPDFAEQMSRAEGSCEARLVASIARHKDWRARAWVLERVFPERYQAGGKGQRAGRKGTAAPAVEGDDETRRRLLGILDKAQEGSRGSGPDPDRGPQCGPGPEA